MPIILHENVEETKIAEKVIAVHELLKKRRQPYEDLKQLAIDLALPRRGDVEDYSEGGRETARGQKRGTEIYDDTAIGAVNTCVNGLQGYHMSPAFNWFRSRYGHKFLRDNSEVKEWLQANDEIIYDILARSETFYDSDGEWMRDGVAPGDGTVYIEPDVANATVQCVVPNLWQMYHLRDCYGRLIAAHRVFKMTASEALDFFAQDQANFSANLKRDAEKNPLSEYQFIHAVYRNPEARPDKLGNPFKPFISFYVEVEAKTLTQAGGYRTENPVIWSVFRGSDEDYGRGIVGDAIVSILTANQFSRILQKVGQKQVEPPWRISDALRGIISLKPDAQNFVRDATDIIEPIVTPINYPVTAEERERIVQAIKDHFMTRFFEMFLQADKEFRVLEIMERRAERASLMGPFLSNLNKVSDLKLDRVFDIAMEAGWLYDPPQIVQDFIAQSNEPGAGIINIDYTGPLAQIQKQLFASQPIQYGLQAVAPIIEAFPETGDIIDADGTGRDILAAFNFPEKRIRSEEVVEQIRQQRQAKQEALENIAAATEIAKSVPSLQKKTEPTSPIGLLTGAAA